MDDDSDERAQKAVAEIVRVRTAGEKVNVAAKAREHKIPVNRIRRRLQNKGRRTD
jgi:hypothetical protein